LIFLPLAIVALFWGSWRAFARVCVGGIFAAASGVLMVAYLQNWEIGAFLRDRLIGIAPPSSAPPPPKEEWLWPRLAHSTLQSYSRFLSPLFCAFALHELFASVAGAWSRRRLGELEAAVLLIGGTMLITAVAGPLYVMIHGFWFLIAIPAASLLAARFVADRGWERSPKAFAMTLLVTTAFFPYGMWKYSFALDLSVGLSFIFVSIGFATWAFRQAIIPRRLSSVLGLVVLLNLLQTLNYRLESHDPRPFCAELLERYIETRAPVRPSRPLFMSERVYYCRGIPRVE
jgi:hypothetical protein